MTPTPPHNSFFSGLSTKVLALTIVFVLLGEVLIFLPSIANYRIQWMKTRIAQAEIAALAAEASPNADLTDALRSEILKGAGVVAVSLKRGDTRQLVLRSTENASVEQNFDLRSGMYWPTLFEALHVLVQSQDRIVTVIDTPPNMSGEWIAVTFHEGQMTSAMRKYGLNILLLSVVLSLIVATMIYAALSRLLVRPMQRLSSNMIAFGEHPEDHSRVISPSLRNDEIGTAERELRDMQSQLQGLLQQKNHLAALGLAVSKVSHDLRNMLTTAQVVSDSLATVKDPQVQRFAPRLITSLDRAINFLNQTLQYGQAREFPPQRMQLDLHDIVTEVMEGLEHTAQGRVTLVNDVQRNFICDADREHLHRILTNLVRNSLQAFDGEQLAASAELKVTVTAQRMDLHTEIEITDNGPGIPPTVRGKLFEAFQSAAKPGGTGLGLAISQELAAAHGGDIKVKYTGDAGTCFIVTIPDGNTGNITLN